MSVASIIARSPDDGLEQALQLLKVVGVVSDSRNGAVIRAPGPVITTYNAPRQRVSQAPLRDANPFFHLYEALWMLAGRRDVESVAKFAKRMSTFSDNGVDLHGAYGWRWRGYFGFDQLREIVKILRNDSSSRRAVLSMWTPDGDLIAGSGIGGPRSLDLPCNTHVYFDAAFGVLNMTVCNRSNDVVWGCYGANVVHMSMLHEFVACATGLPLGSYYQFSNNFHMYAQREDCQRLLHTPVLEAPAGWLVRFQAPFMYESGRVEPGPVLFERADEADDWLEECEAVVAGAVARQDLKNVFLRDVAVPLIQAHDAYKASVFEEALTLAGQCVASDWRTAAQAWLRRRRSAAGYAAAAEDTSDVR